jgi:hypothetical protein
MREAFAVERAYIFMTGVQRDHSKPIDVGYSIVVSFKNFGKTPALIHKVASVCKYFATTPPPKLSKTIPLPFELAVASGDKAGDFPASIDATKEEIDAAKGGRGSIRCIYNIAYADVRGDNHLGGVCLLQDFAIQSMIFCPEKEYKYN